jgi:hypothetical protein
MTIRWEEQDNGDWHGYSGDLVVALAVPDPARKALPGESLARTRSGVGSGSPTSNAAKNAKRWLWEVTVQRPPGWRNEGHRTTALAARRAADDYWTRWCEAAAIKPDIERLVADSSGATQPGRGRRS